MTDERLRRWRLVLGGDGDATGVALDAADARRDDALAALYGRRGGLGGSAPRVARWLGDVRELFPTGVVRVLQSDAMERLGLRQLLLEPELLETVQPDVELVATLLALRHAVPERSRETARAVVRTVVADLESRLAEPTRQAVRGALRTARRTRRPRPSDIDWPATVRANLRHWLPELRTVVPERLVGVARGGVAIDRELVIALDQSGSMASSVVYASVFGAALASLPALRVSLVAFDTEVVELTAQLDDPVDLLFGVQLGGGTDIARALAHCATLVTRPRDTVLVLISDLFEGGDADALVARAARLVADGVCLVALLALDDRGAPAFDHQLAARLAAVGVPSFACTPDRFPELLAVAIRTGDVRAFLAEHDLPLGGGPPV